ncbi:biotin--[acetyl-CoA-carboxylase] ligase [Segatella hominis]|uniref:biotin--[acetyl-CoA-carboxylase] ligase n=1 Tax=Segatella hominis TaxID=2518605 RepID=UPI003AAEAEBA
MKTKIIRLEEIDSTNRYLKNYREEGDEEMIVAVADYQAAGKGQGTHTWESEKGKNLLFSIKVYPHWIPVRRQFVLSMAGALAVKDALDSYVENITLKWPNDVYWNDKKISGTLIENTIDSKGIKSCVFGIGLNVNQLVFHSDAPNPVSLAQILGHEVDRDEVLKKILDGFEKYYELLRRADYMDVSGIYHLSLYRRKGFHPYRDADGEFEGALVEVEDDGHLILHDRQGRIRSYAFGEISIVRE